MPIRTSALRTLGAYANVFALESFMDEVALAAGLPVVAARVILDPLEEALPVSPEEFLNPDGSSSIWKSGLAVAARPVRLPMLWDVGRRSTHAMELLGRWLWRFLDTDTAADR